MEDGQGSTLGLNDQTGARQSNYLYDAFGVTSTLSQNLGWSTPFQYVGGQGYYTDGDSGMQLLGARFYLPKLGRFLTQDPLGHVAGLNLYNYCDGDPVNNTDPDGLDDDDWLTNPISESGRPHAYPAVRKGLNNLANAGAAVVGTVADFHPLSPAAQFYAGRDNYGKPLSNASRIGNGALAGAPLFFAAIRPFVGLGKQFFRMRWARSLENAGKLIYDVDRSERAFVAAVRERFPHIVIYRAEQKSALGDFLLVDISDPQSPVAWFVDTQAGRGGANKMRNVATMAQSLGLDAAHYKIRRGTPEAILNELHGRGGW